MYCPFKTTTEYLPESQNLVWKYCCLIIFPTLFCEKLKLKLKNITLSLKHFRFWLRFRGVKTTNSLGYDTHYAMKIDSPGYDIQIFYWLTRGEGGYDTLGRLIRQGIPAGRVSCRGIIPQEDWKILITSGILDQRWIFLTHWSVAKVGSNNKKKLEVKILVGLFLNKKNRCCIK